MFRFFDSHAHLCASDYDLDSSAVVQRALENNVLHISNCSDSFEMFDQTLKLKKLYPSTCLACLGIHPEFATKDDAYISKAIEVIEANIDKINAIGEVGLDAHWDKRESTLKRQIEVFNKMADLAEKYNKPIVIHAREMEAKALEILKAKKIKEIDMHCYEGSYELALEFIKLNPNVRFGVNGILTFKSAQALRDLYSTLPLKNIFLETDSPELSPIPFRGRRNEPKNIPLIFSALSAIRKEDKETIASTIYESTMRFYGIHD